MKTVTVTRMTDDGKQTLGTLNVVLDDGKEFSCKTLELPWKDNASNVSCIPAGTYPCKYTRSNRMSTEKGHDVYTYEVLNVLQRAGIRIHSANYFTQLLGCFALGDSFADINADKEADVVHSGVTVAAFEAALQKQEFSLIVNAVPVVV